jgi:adenosylcobinamide kinase/adenosylcobinamide-phosphate guanylyltransferase
MSEQAVRRVLVLGGARSGKSAHAERIAAAAEPVTYLATAAADAGDAEWEARIEAHRHRRPENWTTVETREVSSVLGHQANTVLIDSITTWVSGVMDEVGCWTQPPTPDSERRLAAELDELVRAWTTPRGMVVAVSDEVGSGIVPATESGRRYRDVLGDLNQRLAAAADEVWLVTAGIPSRLK